MKTHIYSLLCFLLIGSVAFAQSTSNDQETNSNGQLDLLEEFSTRIETPFVMPDGIELMTDLYLPITTDCLMVSLDIPFVGEQQIELIPKGTQLWVYPERNGQVNPNPFQLPIIMTRTPYRKDGDITGRVMSLLGYGFAMQDMRGRYKSGGVYFPMYSDSWDKNPYHPDYGHVLDVTDLSDPRNGNRHEDGYNSIQLLVNDITKMYDLDGDGTAETESLICNGSIGMFGASALGNTQYQAAAAHRIDPLGPGLKSLLPIVATNEHYKTTGYQNGVFRDRIVTGWLRGQIFDTDDDLNAVDNDIDNNLHSSTDYGLPNKFVAANNAIDHFSTVQYGNTPAGYYPNSRGRADMDASRAYVDENGEGDANGQYSRYQNMEVPAFHVTGWWDIFTDGQIETWQYMKDILDPAKGNNRLQKIIIGPWAHQTIGSTKTGDMTYKENVADLIGIDLEDIDFDNIDVGQVLQSELLSWYRYTLNYNDYANIGNPLARIPESNNWQDIGVGRVRVPSKNFDITFEELINFLKGTEGLKNLSLEIEVLGFPQEVTLDVPATGDPILPQLANGDNVEPFPFIEYENMPDVRFYVVGPVNDGIPENENIGNYWHESDEFPLTQGIEWEEMYLHQDGSMSDNAPSQDEGYSIYVHDPDDPVMTIGGGNMIVKTPQGNRDSQGQMNLADPDFAPYTMDRQGVMKYETTELNEPYCIIGFPEVELYAKSNPNGLTSGLTDTDFFVRVVDVYPDGREMFVVEGAVNARARAYAKSILDGNENDNAPFTNINVGEIYKYEFQMMPIAYTFGKGHKVKILISSSNYTRYQVNPNLPIEEGEFFRRKPNDGRGYEYNGNYMMPRVAVQRVHFSPDHPTHIRFPAYKGSLTSLDENNIHADAFEMLLYPNPTSQYATVFTNNPGKHQVRVLNMVGQEIAKQPFMDEVQIETNNWQAGIYFVEVTSEMSGEKVVRKLIVQ